ncbi:MAG: lmo0937 family membrane protein [Phycisphaerales bacterium]|nr:MAG: lmo0937 family membrane protein [Phycisphaerales bacterium]
MLWTIAIVLLLLWLVGLITANTFGGLIYILLVLALVMVVLQLFQRRGHNA